ncbi:cytochrome b561 [Bradyrhizobium japonicum]|uniref:Cytochrome b561 n=1 Tax=Bradyrhizobium japonicum TaxID=375 RepID=A0ABV2S7A8_BRAJP
MLDGQWSVGELADIASPSSATLFQHLGKVPSLSLIKTRCGADDILQLGVGRAFQPWTSKTSMSLRLHYGTTTKVLHWAIVALLLVQYLIGWLMPDIHRGMQPGVGMTFHVSIGLVLLILIVLRFAWRLTHPVAPESSLPTWHRLTSEVVHWMLYVMVLLTTITGWLFASFRGWSISFFYLVPFPMLFSNNPRPAKRSTVCTGLPAGFF